MDRNPSEPLDENARLMRQVAADDDFEAFERLHQRFAPILMHLYVRRGATRISADDFVQKIFIGLWEQRKSFRGESSFETYLFSMTRHILSKEIRQSRKLTEIDVKVRPQITTVSLNGLSQPEAELYLQELTDALETAKAELTAGQRQALEASQDGDIPMNRILEELGCSHKAYKSRLKRARKRMRELLVPFLKEDKGTP